MPINDYMKQGKSLKDLRKRVDDLGLSIESAIAFPNWAVDDDAARAKVWSRRSRTWTRSSSSAASASPRRPQE